MFERPPRAPEMLSAVSVSFCVRREEMRTALICMLRAHVRRFPDRVTMMTVMLLYEIPAVAGVCPRLVGSEDSR